MEIWRKCQGNVHSEPVNSRKENDRFSCSICLLPKPPPTGLSLYSRFRERELSFPRDLHLGLVLSLMILQCGGKWSENAWFSWTGVSTNLNLTYKIAKIDRFEGHVREDCGNSSDTTALRFKSLSKDNLRTSNLGYKHGSIAGDGGRRPKVPKMLHPSTLASQINKPTYITILYIRKKSDLHGLQYV